MRSEAIGAGMAELSDHAIKSRIVEDLTRARRRTALLTEAVDDDELIRQHSALMSPLVWDLAHIGNQEELWLLRDVGGRDPLLPETVASSMTPSSIHGPTARRCRCWTRPNPAVTSPTCGAGSSTCSTAHRCTADG